MKLENEKVRSDKYYRIGYHAGTGKYILASVVTWIAWPFLICPIGGLLLAGIVTWILR